MKTAWKAIFSKSLFPTFFQLLNLNMRTFMAAIQHVRFLELKLETLLEETF